MAIARRILVLIGLLLLAAAAVLLLLPISTRHVDAGFGATEPYVCGPHPSSYVPAAVVWADPGITLGSLKGQDEIEQSISENGEAECLVAAQGRGYVAIALIAAGALLIAGAGRIARYIIHGSEPSAPTPQ